MDTSLINKLPPELRNNIFEHLLILPADIVIELQHNGPAVDTALRPRIRDALSLMATSKHLRAETIPVFYAANGFTFRTPHLLVARHGETTPVRRVRLMDGMGKVRDWLLDIGECSKHLVSLHLELGAWDLSSSYGSGTSPSDVAPAMRQASKAFDMAKAPVSISFYVDWTPRFDPEARIMVSLSSVEAEHVDAAVHAAVSCVREQLRRRYHPQDWARMEATLRSYEILLMEFAHNLEGMSLSDESLTGRSQRTGFE